MNYVPADLIEIMKVLLNDNKNLYKINALLYSNVGRNCGAIYILLQYIVVWFIDDMYFIHLRKREKR